MRRARAPRLQAPRSERDRRHLREHDHDDRLAERPDRRLRLQRRRRRGRRHRQRRPPRHLLRRQHGLEPPVPEQGAHALRGHHRPRGRQDHIAGPPASTMVDINDDGYLDIYVSVSGPAVVQRPAQRANLLFVNNGRRHLHRVRRRSTASPTRTSRRRPPSSTTTATAASISSCSTTRRRTSPAA